MATKTLLTIEEFLRLPVSDDDRELRYELVEGELVELQPEMLLHNLTRDAVFFTLMRFVGIEALGTLQCWQLFHLFGSTVRRVDVAFVKSGRKLPLDKLPEGAPDLAVEVVSPNDAPSEVERRISDYFAGGCKRVWVFHPEHREVYIHGLAGVTRRRADETLEDAELLPEFSVKVSEFFV